MWNRLKRLPDAIASTVTQSLSGRLLLFTIAFVMLAEALLYFPSLARFYQDQISNRLAAAQIAVLALDQGDPQAISPQLKVELLANAGVRAVALKRNNTRRLYLAEAMPPEISMSVDLRDVTLVGLASYAVDSMIMGDGRTLRIVGKPRLQGGEFIEAVVDEAPLREELLSYSARIFELSLFISIVTASLVFATLYFTLVRPMQRLTQSMVSFQEKPEDAQRIIIPSQREDEIGQSERVLATMQGEIRQALQQREHLVALGSAVAKIQHDLRNILSSAQLASDRLAASNDPAVQRLAPRLMKSIDRAIDLATNTLKYGRAEEAPKQRHRQPLLPLAEEAMHAALAAGDGRVAWRNDFPADLEVDADGDQMLRILVNLGRNAVEALEGRNEAQIAVSAQRGDDGVTIDVSDNGGGIPEEVLKHLFEAFAGRGRVGGTGLGLAIARELARGHGGDVVMLRTGPEGTTFRITIPDAQATA
ncbi:MAG: sensor histidine kinase [Alphaproteobacteria bacterium]|nr:sensor histidine kinase [Alphaproteobacteria bacterium]